MVKLNKYEKKLFVLTNWIRDVFYGVKNYNKFLLIMRMV